MIVKIEVSGRCKQKVDNTFLIMEQLKNIFDSIHNIKITEITEVNK